MKAKEYKLRYYQEDAIKATFKYINGGGKAGLVVIPTAGGKSLIIADMVKRILMKKPNVRIMMLTHVKELIEQNMKELRGIWPNAPAGIYSAGIGLRQYRFPITFAGIQSAYKKPQIFGHIDMLIVDECHLVSENAETMYGAMISELRKKNPNMVVLGLTATAYRMKLGLLIDGPIFDDNVYDCTQLDDFVRMIDEGYLSDIISIRTETQFDLTDVKIIAGEYSEKSLDENINRDTITKQIVDETIRRTVGRNKGLAFCVSVSHAENMAHRFNERGVPSDFIHSGLTKEKRAEVLARFKSGEIKLLTNVGVLCLDSKTEILTAQGWISKDDMTYQHDIAAWKMDGTIEFTKPEYILRRKVNPGEQYLVPADGAKGAKFKVTDKHRMVVGYGLNRSKLKVVLASELEGKAFSSPVFGNAPTSNIEVEQEVHNQPFNLAIRVNSCVLRKKGMNYDKAKSTAIERLTKRRSMKYLNPNQLTLDQCKFIGFWLGDGTKSEGRISLAQSMRYPDNIEWVNNTLGKCGLHYVTRVYKPDAKSQYESIRWELSRGTGFGDQSVDGGYYELEPYLNKSGTDLFWGLNKQQYEALLEGFHKADGNHHSQHHQKAITNTSKSLLDILQAVGTCRGINIRLSPALKPREPHHLTQWTLSFSGNKTVATTTRNGGPKLIDVDPNDEVWCVTSSTSYIITRHEGVVMVTGNTTGFNAPDIDYLVLARPTQSTSLHVQMVGRGMRVHESKPNTMVLDYAGNTIRLGPINDPVLPVKKGEAKGDAPIRVCPECDSICHAALKLCPVCGFEFPPPKVKIDVVMSGADIIKRKDVPNIVDLPVTCITVNKHRSAKGNDTVKIGFCTEEEGVLDQYFMFDKAKKAVYQESVTKARKLKYDVIIPEFENTEQAFLFIKDHALQPTTVKVWKNKPMTGGKRRKEVIAYSYEETTE